MPWPFAWASGPTPASSGPPRQAEVAASFGHRHSAGGQRMAGRQRHRAATATSCCAGLSTPAGGPRLHQWLAGSGAAVARIGEAPGHIHGQHAHQSLLGRRPASARRATGLAGLACEVTAPTALARCGGSPAGLPPRAAKYLARSGNSSTGRPRRSMPWPSPPTMGRTRRRTSAPGPRRQPDPGRPPRPGRTGRREGACEGRVAGVASRLGDLAA